MKNLDHKAGLTLSEELLKELQAVPEIRKALKLLEVSSYTEVELESYDKFRQDVKRKKREEANVESNND